MPQISCITQVPAKFNWRRFSFWHLEIFIELPTYTYSFDGLLTGLKLRVNSKLAHLCPIFFCLSRTFFLVTYSLGHLYARKSSWALQSFNAAVSCKLGRTLLTCFTIFSCVTLGAYAHITVILVMCSTHSIVLTRPTNAWRLKRRRIGPPRAEQLYRVTLSAVF